MSRRRLTTRGARDSDGGVALIEFALIAPLLLAILFGIIEFGWAFYQVLDTRHSAREGARLAAVNYTTGGVDGDAQRDLLVAETCARLENPQLSRVELSFASAGSDKAGDLAVVRVERDLEQLTSFFSGILDGRTPSSEVTFRLERDASWTATAGVQACP